MLEDDADAVAQLLDLARDIFGTPVAALTREGLRRAGGEGADGVQQTSSVLDPRATVRLLADTDLDRSVLAVPVVRPDGEPDGRLVGVPDGEPEELSSRQLEALHVVSALLAGVLHHRERRQAERSSRLASLDALVAGTGRSTVLQPIVDLRDGALVGAEALSRFTTADGVPQRPEQVFADARSSGAGVRLERAAIASALPLLGELPAGAYLGVNASAEALLDPGTQRLLLSGDPHRLVVEVTEHDPVTDYASLAASTADLRAAGVRLAVDDAGAGFASLQHVLHLAPDIVKLDGAFVRGIDADPARRAVARALVGFASELGSTTVAEGVERTGELEVLRDLGVHCGQGYLLGRPGAALAPGPVPPAGRVTSPDDTTVVELPVTPVEPEEHGDPGDDGAPP
ncbi:EAL domain-containing protein [Kineococcus terrestris]|uniref:EAL domain-containing protein n=1 Tax=Kineococcus terrestris TaxID=2044856 RepID=UPI0034DAD3AB